MKNYIIWTNHGHEGWSPDYADTFEEAMEVRDNCMSMHYTTNVVVTKLVRTETKELEDNQT